MISSVLQREARGSVTFKIVPSYRSAPPPCEVQVSPKDQTYSQSNTTTTITTTATTTITTNITTATASTSVTTAPSAAGNSKSVKTQTPKDLKSQKPQKAPKLKIGSSSSNENTPRRRLNPLSVLRSRKSKS